MAKAGRKPIKGTKMTERLYVRATPEEKSKWEQAVDVAPGYTGGTVTDFFRPMIDAVSEYTVQLANGEISPEQFQRMIGKSVFEVAFGDEPKKT